MNTETSLKRLDSVWQTIRKARNDIEQGNVDIQVNRADRFSGVNRITRHWPITENGNWLKGIRDMFFDNVRFELRYGTEDNFTIYLAFLKNGLVIEKVAFGNAVISNGDGEPVSTGFLMDENCPLYQSAEEIWTQIVWLTAYVSIKQIDRKTAGEMFCNVLRRKSQDPQNHVLASIR